MKKWISMLAVLSMLATLFVPMTALAQEYTPLTLGESVTVTLAVGQEQWYQFTPAETKTYRFYSENQDNVDPLAELYDSSMTMIANNDDSDGSNFCVTAELTAGETYYLKAYEFDLNNEGSYTLTVGVALPTDVFFDEYSIETFVGAEYTMTAHVYPESADNTMTWTSSNESVATVDENGTVTFLSAGETQIIAETPNGLSDTCWFTVYAVNGALELGAEREIEYTVGVETRKESQRYFTFTPDETGYYRLYSYDIVSDLEDTAIDPRAWVFDVLRNELEYDDDGGEDVNVSLDAALEAGVTYYFMVELYDSQATGSFKVKLEEINTADSVSIDSDDLMLEEGSSFDIYVTYSPAGSWQEDYVVTSSDESVVRVEDKAIMAVGSGEATVTVTTDLGLTDSITVTVYGIDEIVLDEVYTLEGTGDDYGGSKRYAFTPTESGIYTITSFEAVGEGATVSVAISNMYEQLRCNDTETSSFKLTYELEASKTYYYDVSLECEAEQSSVNFVLTKEDAEIPVAEINTDYLAEIVNPSDGVYYAFTPKFTGMYTIFSTPYENNSIDTKLYVYTDQWELFYSNDDGAGDNQFCLEEEFTAGETYYLKAFAFSDNDSGAFTVRIEPLFDLPETGDLSFDGQVNMMDVMALYNGAGGKAELNISEEAVADIDGNGVVNMMDVMALYKQVGGM